MAKAIGCGDSTHGHGELHGSARRVRGWRIVHTRRVTAERSVAWRTVYETKEGDFRFTPQLPDPASLRKRLSRRLETVTLIPYGCGHLRLTVFAHAR